MHGPGLDPGASSPADRAEDRTSTRHRGAPRRDPAARPSLRITAGAMPRRARMERHGPALGHKAPGLDPPFTMSPASAGPGHQRRHRERGFPRNGRAGRPPRLPGIGRWSRGAPPHSALLRCRRPVPRQRAPCPPPGSARPAPPGRAATDRPDGWMDAAAGPAWMVVARAPPPFGTRASGIPACRCPSARRRAGTKRSAGPDGATGSLATARDTTRLPRRSRRGRSLGSAKAGAGTRPQTVAAAPACARRCSPMCAHAGVLQAIPVRSAPSPPGPARGATAHRASGRRAFIAAWARGTCGPPGVSPSSRPPWRDGPGGARRHPRGQTRADGAGEMTSARAGRLDRTAGLRPRTASVHSGLPTAVATGPPGRNPRPAAPGRPVGRRSPRYRAGPARLPAGPRGRHAAAGTRSVRGTTPAGPGRP
jgi:hypothetical protein